MRVVNTFWGTREIRCEPGEKEYPATCERHTEHYWCEVCEGYYGVPHDNVHPHREMRDCWCRPCRNYFESREDKTP